MADRYVGSVQHAAVPQWAATTAKSVGDFVRQLAAPSAGNERVFRCTTAGTTGGSEPSWNLNLAATTNDGTAVWTEVTGNSLYGWSAASAYIDLIAGRSTAGDNIWVADDHNYIRAAGFNISFGGGSTVGNPVKVVCVDPAGSVPPVAADISSGGKETVNAAADLTIQGGPAYIQGLVFQCGTGVLFSRIIFRGVTNPTTFKMVDCDLILGGTSSDGNCRILINNNIAIEVEWDNVRLQFSHANNSLFFGGDSSTFRWRNTPSALSGTLPTTLIQSDSRFVSNVIDGVDLSAFSGRLVGALDYARQGRFYISNSKLHASVNTVPLSITNRRFNGLDIVASDDGTLAARNESHRFHGALTTETTIVRTGGASSFGQGLSWKVVTTADARLTFPFETFQFAIPQSSVGSPVTMEVEVLTDGVTLTDADAWLEVEYMGDATSPLASILTDRVATILTTPANQTASAATWTTTGLGSPVTQKLEVTFTPEIAGPVRARVCVARASTTVYIDPKPTIV